MDVFIGIFQAACEFDDVLVLRQLRYTGMLATVKIRQSGYNYRLKFEVSKLGALEWSIPACHLMSTPQRLCGTFMSKFTGERQFLQEI